MKPWTLEEYDKFKLLICDENICSDCSECDRNNQDILDCFDELVADL